MKKATKSGGKTKGKKLSKRTLTVEAESVPVADVPGVGVQVNEIDTATAQPEATVPEAGVKPTKGRRSPRAATSGAKGKATGPKPLSCLDAAVAVLKAKGEPMRCQEMIDAMKEQKLWTSDAPTPAATLSSAILREMKKGETSRFKTTDRGHFALNA